MKWCSCQPAESPPSHEDKKVVSELHTLLQRSADFCLPPSPHLLLLLATLQRTLLQHIKRTTVEIGNWSSLSKTSPAVIAAYRKEAAMNIASHSVYSTTHLKSTPASVLSRELLLQNQLPPILSEYLLDSLESSGAQFYPSCHWGFLFQQTGSPIDFGRTSGIKPSPFSIKTADAVFKHLLAAGMVLWLQASNANECKITYQKKKRQIFEESYTRVGGRHFGEITKTTLSKIDLPYSKH